MAEAEWKRARRVVNDSRGMYWGTFTPRAWASPITPPVLQGIARANVGCGRNLMPGFHNVDRRPHPGAGFGDLEDRLPFQDRTIEFVFARHVLEHVVDFGSALEEIRRVLQPGGILEAVVPYRADNENPYHLRRFTHRSLWAVCGPGNTLEGVPDAWTPLFIGITRRGFPWVQVQRTLGLNLPVGPRLEMTFVLRKTA